MFQGSLIYSRTHMSGLLGIALGLTSALFKSASELTSKFYLNDDLNEYVASWALRAFAIPMLAVMVAYTGIPNISSDLWYVLAFNVPASIVATILYMKAIKVSDVSIISPLGAVTPIFLLITSPLLVNEFPSPIGILGVFIITAGVYLLKLDTASTGDVLAPFRAIAHEEGARYILGVVLIYSISGNLDKLGVEASSPVFYALIVHVLVTLGLTIVVLLKVDDWQSEVTSQWKAIAPIGALSGIAIVAQMTALTYTLAVYVLALKRVGILLSVAGGSILLDEGNLRERLGGTAIIIFGVILVSLALL